MLPRADMASLRPSTAVDAPGPIVATGKIREELYQRLGQIPIGKPLPAEVLALLDDGTQLVRIADAQARMALPVGTKVGDTMNMVMVAKEPRPTFLVVPPDESAPSSLSPAGRLIANLLQSTPQDKALPIQPKTPVIAAAQPAVPLPSQAMAEAMQHSVEYSGVFYESHLHQWLDGSRPLEELQREPQAQLNARSPQPARAGTDAEPLSSAQLARLAARLNDSGSIAGGKEGGAAILARLIDDSNARQMQVTGRSATDVTVIAPNQGALPELAQEAAGLIQQQLATLEQQRIQWRGELYPGQPMEWDIARDAPPKESPQAPEASWTSQLRLELPMLGDIAATVRLVGGKVQIQVDTENAAAGDLLQANGTALANAMADAGLPLEFFSVKRHGSP
jgi:hypothetical protein